MTELIEIYQLPNGEAQIDIRFDQDTVWLSQSQIANLFDTSADNVSLHLKNVYQEQELDELGTTEDFSVVRQEGKRRVKRQLKHYNLEAIISVGYRIKSYQATQFQIWATNRLKDYLVKGYAINEQRLKQNANELEQVLALIKKTSNSQELTFESSKGLVDIVSRYASTFLWLQQYDEGLLNEPPTQTGGILASYEQAKKKLALFKAELMQRNEATELFALERRQGLKALLGNLEQSIFGEPAYPSI